MTKRLIAIFALVGAFAFAEEVKPPTPVMTQEQSKDVAIIQLQDQILDLQSQLNDKDKEIIEMRKQIQQTVKAEKIKGICDDKKVPLSECSIDPKTGQVNRNPPVVAAK